MKKLKKPLSLLLTFVMTLTVLCGMFAGTKIEASASTGGKTAQQALQWVKDREGKKVGEGQCVSLTRDYISYLGNTFYGWAYQYRTKTLPNGWVRIQGAQPKLGDILIYTDTSGSESHPGHVAIYESDYVTWHQNYSGFYVQKVTNKKYNQIKASDGSPYWGVIRPDFKTSSSSGTTNAKLYIKFNANGGVISGTNQLASDGTVCYEDMNTVYQMCDSSPYDPISSVNGLWDVSTLQLTKTNYTFVGWSTDSSGNGVIFDQDDTSIRPVDISKDILKGDKTVTLYAIWRPNRLYIKFNANGGVVSGTNQLASDGTVCYEDMYTVYQVCDSSPYDPISRVNGLWDVSTLQLTKTNYTFVGWSTDSSGNGVIFDQDDTSIRPVDISKDILKGDKTVTLYAIWEKNHIKSGWCQVSGYWYYYLNGTKISGWIKDNGKWYYLNSSGAMVTGWGSIDGKWYYFNNSGAMQTGWLQLGGKWYYLNSSGAMVTGWGFIGGKWYYFNNSGAMLTGWQQIGGKWYYFNSSGAMATGWIKLSGKWYYLNSSGAMVTGSQRINGKTYRFNSNGVWIA